jgi:hypothetical protein
MRQMLDARCWTLNPPTHKAAETAAAQGRFFLQVRREM